MSIATQLLSSGLSTETFPHYLSVTPFGTGSVRVTLNPAFGTPVRDAVLHPGQLENAANRVSSSGYAQGRNDAQIADGVLQIALFNEILFLN